MSFSTRLAAPSDYATITRLFPELHIPDPLPDVEHFTQRMLPRVLLLDDRDATVAYAFWQVYGRTAHIVHLVVDPRSRGRGAGRVIMGALRDVLRGEGCTRMYLNVKRDNVAALRLYQRAGLHIEHDTWLMRIDLKDIDLLVENDDCEVCPIDPRDDAELAARFVLPVERIGVLRARPGMALIGLREASQIVAFAAFDPAVPIAYPFRVARRELARPLLQACREHVDRSRFDFLHLNVEGDAALKDTLLRAGGEVSFEVVQMGAALS